MRYLVSGYYGEGNAGDEAILAGILKEIRQRDVDAEMTVLSFDPEDTLFRHQVAAVSTSLRKAGRILAAMASADLLISGGGSFLHEADFALYGRSFLLRQGKLRPVPYFLSVVLLAESVGLPVMWYAQGLGPLHTQEAKRLVGLAGSGAAAVTWRDEGSARLAWSVGVRSTVQLVVPDPAYGLEPRDGARVKEILFGLGLRSRRGLIVACPRPWLGRTGYHEQLALALGRIAERHDLDVLLLPFQQRTDGPLCDELARHPALVGRARAVPGIDDPALLAAILGAARFAVTMRLHSCILAAAAGTPAVCIDYDPKVRAFASQTGQAGFAVGVDMLETSMGGQALEAAAEATLRSLEQRRAALAGAVAPLREGAGRTAQLAVSLAAHGGLPGMPRTRLTPIKACLERYWRP